MTLTIIIFSSINPFLDSQDPTKLAPLTVLKSRRFILICFQFLCTVHMELSTTHSQDQHCYLLLGNSRQWSKLNPTTCDSCPSVTECYRCFVPKPNRSGEASCVGGRVGLLVSEICFFFQKLDNISSVSGGLGGGSMLAPTEGELHVGNEPPV